MSAQIRRLPGLPIADELLSRQYKQAETRLEDKRKENVARRSRQ